MHHPLTHSLCLYCSWLRLARISVFRWSFDHSPLLSATAGFFPGSLAPSGDIDRSAREDRQVSMTDSVDGYGVLEPLTFSAVPLFIATLIYVHPRRMAVGDQALDKFPS